MTWQPDDAEIRRNALALFQAWQQAVKQYEDSGEDDEPGLPDEAQAKIQKANQVYWEKQGELRKALDAEREAIEAQYRPSGPSALRRQMESARVAYEEAPGDSLLTNWQDEPILCAKSGLPILESDEYVEDEETGEHFLRAALGLPPRPVEADDVEEAA